MIARWLALLLLLVAAPLAAQEPPVPAATKAPAVRVLVMLALPPDHYRPASDYGVGGGYGDAASAAARRRLAQRIAREHGLKLDENWAMPLIDIDCVVMTIPDGRAAETVAAELSRVAGVSWSQPLNSFEAQAAAPPQHNDRLYRAQPAAAAWGLADLHRFATGRGVKVAVIDSQIDRAHPDLRGRIAAMQNFATAMPPRPESHGTGIAGIIGANAGDGLGIAGVAPGAAVMGLRACWQRPGSGGTVCDSLSLARALVWAIEHDAAIVNMSLSGPPDRLVARLVEVAIRRGAIVVASLDPRDPAASFPARLPGVIAVAYDGVAGGGAGVYNAPGRDIPTTEPGGGWDLVSGTSYAAAHVSGLLALARELGARRAPAGWLVAAGRTGDIDACGTLQRLARGRPMGCTRASLP